MINYWDFHGTIVKGHCDNALLNTAWIDTFASRPLLSAETKPHIQLHFTLSAAVPAPPKGDPAFSQGDLLHYFINGDEIVAWFPRFGRLDLNLATGTTHAVIVSSVLSTYGVLEDMLAISLSPHLRRRGFFLIHAFAAALHGKAVLLVGGIGAGKTTTGMSLLDAGWRLLSNDSPIVNGSAEILSYPGQLAGYPETFARFPSTQSFAERAPTQSGRQKLLVPADECFPGTWLEKAPIGAIIFPQIEKRTTHSAEPLSQPEALRRLLPHAVEQWDKPMIPRHFGHLRNLVNAAPAYLLRLGPDVLAIPALIETLLA